MTVPSGLADSGEVEDYPVTIAAAPRVVVTKTTAAGPGGPFSFTLSGTGQASGSVSTLAAGVPVQVDGNDAVGGVQPFVASVGADVTITEGAVAGWALTGAVCTTASGDVVGRLSGATVRIPGSVMVPGAVITCAFSNGVPAVSLVKSHGGITDLDGNGPDAGDAVKYSFVVKNTGHTKLSDVTVSDPMVGPVACPASSLAVGASMTCTGTYHLSQDGVTAGSVVNTAVVSARPPSGQAVTGTSTVTTSVERRPAVELVKSSDAVGSVSAGGLVRFTFTVKNTGNMTLSEVAVSDPMTGPVTCPAVVLAPGESTVCTAAPYRVTAADAKAGKLVNTATVRVLAAGLDVVLTREASVTVRTSSPLAKTGLPVGGEGLALAMLLLTAGLTLTITARRSRVR